MAASRRAYAYALSLVAGTLFLTPSSGLLLNRIGLPLTPALLATLALVFGAYGVVALWLDDTHLGLLIAVLVLTTVAANVPLGSLPPGVAIGPNLYIVDIPLLIGVALTLPTWRREHLSVAHGFLAAYVVWAFLLVGIAPGPRPDVMFWYAIHVARIALVFAFVSRGVTDDRLTARTALGVVVLTAVGHGVVASVQVFTGPIGGLTVLGVNPRVIATLPLGPLGSIPTGPYVGGFTGGAPFSMLLTIIIPIVAATFFLDRVPRIVAVGAVAWLAFLVQLTAWDSARGALLVALGSVLALLGWWATGVLWDRTRRIDRVLVNSWLVRRWTYPVGGAVILATICQLVHFGSNPTYHPVYLDPGLGQSFAQSTSVPGFNTRNLAIRLTQYVGGLDIFLQYPLTGFGGANFYYVALIYGPKAHMIHNLYIGVLAETGFVGAFLFFGALGYAARTVWLTADQTDDPLFIGLFAGIVGILALQFFQPQYLRTTAFVPVWALLGIGCGHYQRTRFGSLDDRWGRAWTISRLRFGTVSARVTRAVEAFPRWIHNTLHGSRLLSPVDESPRLLFRVGTRSVLVSAFVSAYRLSTLICVWRRIRRYCRESKLFE
jgi:hypothetical protein